MQYHLPTDRQIVLHWDAKPCAKIVALIIRDFANEKYGGPIEKKEYEHMSQQDRDKLDKEQQNEAKVWISVRQLAQIARASEEGVDSALNQLQKKKLVATNRPKGKPKKKGNKSSYWYRLLNQ